MSSRDRGRLYNDRPAPDPSRSFPMATVTPRMLFVNIAVDDLARSVAFFGELGFTFDPRFTDEQATCMILSDQVYVSLLVKGPLQGLHAQGAGRPAGARRRRSWRSRRRAARTSTASPTRRWPRAAPSPPTRWSTASCTPAASTTSTATSGRSCGIPAHVAVAQPPMAHDLRSGADRHEAAAHPAVGNRYVRDGVGS